MKSFLSSIIITSFFLTLFFVSFFTSVFAQDKSDQFKFLDFDESTSTEVSNEASSTELSASDTAANIINQRQSVLPSNDLTQPEELPEKVAIISLFEARLVDEPNLLNIMAYWVQESVRDGIPANTIFLILLTPFLALLVSFTRIVLGLPTLDMLVPIALSFALVAVGITVGLLVLTAIIIASYIAKKSLSSLRIMFYPKRSLSMVFLSISVFAALSLGVVLEFERILSVSIFPILVLMLLGDMIVSVQLHKSSSETFVITGTTILIGLVGYFAATNSLIQNVIILYPETVLLVIPANILVGRYFGLRLLELFRFNKVVLD
ncbi:hypothetical protein KC730_02790 [Candidatus Kaiserbacteria bacterium]|nr:hypothetical protein [Candidatus Kaiserbacteria bacterium]